MQYPEIIEAVGEGFAPAVVATNMFVDEIAEPAVSAVVDRLTESGSDLAVVQVRVLGGAVARVPDDATAFAHRRRQLMVNVAAVDFAPGRLQEHEAWVTDLAETIRGDQEAGAYVGFLDDVPEAKVRAAYPGSTWDRLADVKRRYDPDNLFRRTHTIPPTG